MPGIEGRYDPNTGQILLPGRTWTGAEKEVPRFNWSISHEIGHVAIRPSRARNRSASPQAFERVVPSISRDERPAHRFAAAFVAPFHKAQFSPTTKASDLVSRFNLSDESAEIRLGELGRIYRRRLGLERPLPLSGIAYLLEAEQSGQTVNLTLSERAIAGSGALQARPVCPQCGRPGLTDFRSTTAQCRTCGLVAFPDGDRA